MFPSSIRVSALILFAVMGAGACTPTNSTDQPSEPVLRVYQVPPARTEALGMALNDVFQAGNGQAPRGKASSRVPGQLLVLAPGALHASIEQTLGQLVSDTGDRATATRNVQLRVWLIDAVPGSADGTPSPIPSPVVASLARQFEGLAFELHDQARLGIRGMQGNAQVSTAAGTVVQTNVWQESNGLLADIEVSSRATANQAPLSTRIALPLDEFVVLAVTGAPGAEAGTPQRIVVVQATSG